MKVRGRIFWSALLPAGVAICCLAVRAAPELNPAGSLQAAENPPEESGGLPPLVVNKEKPLLLEGGEPGEPKEELTGAMAENAACYCCHTNYKEEPFVQWHAKEDVGCMECHGKSYDHRNDEDNITPPDIMYALEDVDKSCGKCHDEHDAPATKVIARWQERCPAKSDPRQIVCTDCHGQHRLRFRTIWWNKKTRELIVREEGQLIRLSEDFSEKPAPSEPPEESPPDSPMQD
jgi:hypothetical protein